MERATRRRMSRASDSTPDQLSPLFSLGARIALYPCHHLHAIRVFMFCVFSFVCLRFFLFLSYRVQTLDTIISVPKISWDLPLTILSSESTLHGVCPPAPTTHSAPASSPVDAPVALATCGTLRVRARSPLRPARTGSTYLPPPACGWCVAPPSPRESSMRRGA